MTFGRLQFEYINPLAGLVMLVIGLFLVIYGYWVYGVTPVAVGLVLVICYRKYLFQMLGTAY